MAVLNSFMISPVKNYRRIFLRLGLVLVVVVFAAGARADDDLAVLGQALFFDTNLSLNRTQACASCHDPAAAFTDSRDNGFGGAVSLGDDGVSLGDRNTPTLTYAALTPDFGIDDTGAIAGGLFYDGRAKDLADQAGQPFTNPIEMNLPDNAAVVERVLENPGHVAALKQHFGASIFDDAEAAFRAITASIAAFERTAGFAPFDSKYDRFLRGEVALTAQEELGRKLFYSRNFNCHTCHLIDHRELVEGAAFTTHRYFNIGVPVNEKVRERNGLGAGHTDLGLLENPAVDDPAQAGKVKVPTLRNIAVTGPYMHNGVFKELETVIVFYNKFILTNAESQTNPETGLPWGDPEVPDTVDTELLAEGQPISSLQVRPLVAFLKTLTDRRYEHLLDD
jgi:cytochrome c peroxidase